MSGWAGLPSGIPVSSLRFACGRDKSGEWRLGWRGQAGLREECVVEGGEVAAALICGRQATQLDLEDGGLETVQAGVPA